MWTKELLEKCYNLLIKGKSYREVAVKLCISYNSVAKKMRKEGYNISKLFPDKRYLDTSKKKKHKAKKCELINWQNIQSDYDNNKITYRTIIKKYGITPSEIQWAQKNNLLKLRTLSDAVKLSFSNGKRCGSSEGLKRYRQLCEFKFNLSNFPDEFDFNLIKAHGWYSAPNKGNNLSGVSRDHIVSVKFGFINSVNPKIISHPANCRLITNTDNQKKHSKSLIKIEELIEKIKNWDEKYKCPGA